jgi:hypothetical protein
MRRGWGFLVVAALGLTGCGGSAQGPVTEAAPAGVSVSVLQYRLDYAIRHIQIKVTNDGKAPITVNAARLTSNAFTGDALWTAKTPADFVVINPGDATDLPAQLGPSKCPGPAAKLTGSVQLGLEQGSTAIRTTPLTADDPFGSIDQVHGEDCRRAAALAVAQITLVDPLRTRKHGKQLDGELDVRLTPTGKAGTLTVDSIGATTLLDPPNGEAWPVNRTVSASTGPQTVTLPLHPARCDPHAIAEDKLGSVLSLNLRVDGGTEGIVAVAADQQLRRQIQDFVLAACGL